MASSMTLSPSADTRQVVMSVELQYHEMDNANKARDMVEGIFVVCSDSSSLTDLRTLLFSALRGVE